VRERAGVNVGTPVLYSGTPDLEHPQVGHHGRLACSVEAKPRIKH
jgi:hypothetical protein